MFRALLAPLLLTLFLSCADATEHTWTGTITDALSPTNPMNLPATVPMRF
jgi:hypothetical protein